MQHQTMSRLEAIQDHLDACLVKPYSFTRACKNSSQPSPKPAQFSLSTSFDPQAWDLAPGLAQKEAYLTELLLKVHSSPFPSLKLEAPAGGAVSGFESFRARESGSGHSRVVGEALFDPLQVA